MYFLCLSIGEERSGDMTVSTLNSSSVVESTWRKRHKAEAAKKSFLSSAFILAALCIIYIDVLVYFYCLSLLMFSSPCFHLCLMLFM